MEKYPSVQELRCFEFSGHFAKTAEQIENVETPEQMDIFP